MISITNRAFREEAHLKQDWVTRHFKGCIHVDNEQVADIKYDIDKCIKYIKSYSCKSVNPDQRKRSEELMKQALIYLLDYNENLTGDNI